MKFPLGGFLFFFSIVWVFTFPGSVLRGEPEGQHNANGLSDQEKRLQWLNSRVPPKKPALRANPKAVGTPPPEMYAVEPRPIEPRSAETRSAQPTSPTPAPAVIVEKVNSRLTPKPAARLNPQIAETPSAETPSAKSPSANSRPPEPRSETRSVKLTTPTPVPGVIIEKANSRVTPKPAVRANPQIAEKPSVDTPSAKPPSSKSSSPEPRSGETRSAKLTTPTPGSAVVAGKANSGVTPKPAARANPQIAETPAVDAPSTKPPSSKSSSPEPRSGETRSAKLTTPTPAPAVVAGKVNSAVTPKPAARPNPQIAEKPAVDTPSTKPPSPKPSSPESRPAETRLAKLTTPTPASAIVADKGNSNGTPKPAARANSQVAETSSTDVPPTGPHSANPNRPALRSETRLAKLTTPTPAPAGDIDKMNSRVTPKSTPRANPQVSETPPDTPPSEPRPTKTHSAKLSTPAPTAPNRYPWKTNIVTTVFWIGEAASGRNFTPNYSSSWDAKWARNYGGFDNPNPSSRRNFIPVKFSPRQNPFYVALPYNDVTRGKTKPEARRVIPWFKEAFQKEGQSICRDRWVAVRNHSGKIAYAQWSDCGPFRTDHWQYVFGNEKPKPNLNKGAGLDTSPALRDYLGLESTDVTDWRFVDAKDVPSGPWALYGDNNTFVQKSSRTPKNAAKPVEQTAAKAAKARDGNAG